MEFSTLHDTFEDLIRDVSMPDPGTVRSHHISRRTCRADTLTSPAMSAALASGRSARIFATTAALSDM
jgi:hypothetical protein